MRAVAVITVAVAIVLVGVAASHAVWPVNVVKYPGDQRQAAIVSDEAGGAIVAWADYRGGSNFDIYAQRVDEFGVPLWANNGVAICTFTGDQTYPFIVEDGAGGAVIVWFDHRNGGNPYLFGQRVDASGATMWASNGVALSNVSSLILPLLPIDPLPADVISDGAGGAIVAWHGVRGTAVEINAQRVGASGSVLWGAGGVAVTSSPPYNKYRPKLASDGSGGAILAWEDTNPPDDHVRAQRLDAGGSPMWSAGGVQVTSPIEEQDGVAIVSDGEDGAIVAWTDYRNVINGGDVWGQRIDASGTRRWAAEGVPLCVDPDHSTLDVALVPDGYGGAFVVWDNGTSPRTQIFYLVVDSLGLTWPECGMEISSCSGYTPPRIVPDGLGAAIVAYDCSPYNFEVNRITDFQGPTYGWYGGVSGYVSPGEPAIATVEGGVMLAFADSLWGSADVYVERIETRLGYNGHPEPAIAGVSDVPNDQGERVVVSWDPSDLDRIGSSYNTHYSVWRATDSAALSPRATASVVSLADVGRGFDGPAYRVEQVGGQTYYWEWIANQDALALEGYSLTAATRYDSTASDPGWHYFQVVSHTDNPAVFWPCRPDSGYSVDNLTPGPPMGFAVDYNTGAGNHLTWDPSPESDVVLYRVYRSIDPHFVPGPTNWVHSTAATEWIDPDYDGWNFTYKITAVDDAGNESGPAVPGAVTDIDATPSHRFSLEASVPNPFNPSTRINFSLDVDGLVSLRIYDVKGHLVAVLVDGTKNRGAHSESWDGRDQRGQPVASGVYVYQLRSAGRTLSRKAVLLK